MLLWIAILLLLDAGFALWLERRLDALFPRLSVRQIALLEGGIGVVLAAVHFWRHM